MMECFGFKLLELLEGFIQKLMLNERENLIPIFTHIFIFFIYLLDTANG